MGFRVLLIAVGGKDPAVIQQEYGVIPTEDVEEIPESPVCGTTLPDGSYLLYINDEIVPTDSVFAKLSRGAELLACYVNETVINSFATHWVDGIEQWSVFHVASQGVTHLQTNGDLPPEFEPIRNDLFARQQSRNDADYVYDIPVQLVKQLGGFTYDSDPPGAEPFRVLKRA